MKELEDYLNHVFGATPVDDSQPSSHSADIESVETLAGQPENLDFLAEVSEFVETLAPDTLPAIDSPGMEMPMSSLPDEQPSAEAEEPALPPASLEDCDEVDWTYSQQHTTSAMCLEVAGIRFAIPKAAVSQVLYRSRVQDDSQAPWHWGTVESGQRRCVAVDTGWLFMGDRYHAGLREHYRKVIVIESLGLALAADAIADEVQIPPEGVTWRDDTTHRPWLAGTWPEHPCALVDLSALVKELKELSHE